MFPASISGDMGPYVQGYAACPPQHCMSGLSTPGDKSMTILKDDWKIFFGEILDFKIWMIQVTSVKKQIFYILTQIV